jgi:hypothetical protein
VNAQPWEAPPPSLPPQTGLAEPVAEALVGRERGRNEGLVAARSSSDAIIEATIVQRERELAAQRERERIERERVEGGEREHREREQREAALREQIDEIGAATSEVTSDAVLRLVKWSIGTVCVGLAWKWLTSESRASRPAMRGSRRRHQEVRA